MVSNRKRNTKLPVAEQPRTADENAARVGPMVRFQADDLQQLVCFPLRRDARMNTTSEQRTSSIPNWIGVVSWHPLVTRFLCDFLRGSRRLRRFITGAQPVNLDKGGDAQCPSVILLDTLLEDRTSPGTEALARVLRRKFPSSKLIGLASHSDEQVIRLLQLGFSGVLQITNTFECDITSAVTAVLSGSIWAPDRAIRNYSGRIRAATEVRFGLDHLLTPRESQIFESILWGRSNKEIAGSLAIAERTVKFHLSNVLSKMNVGRRRELATVVGWPCESNQGGLVAPIRKLGILLGDHDYIGH
jgi:NarL family two-component system response regulator LiaR